MMRLLVEHGVMGLAGWLAGWQCWNFILICDELGDIDGCSSW
jgi:hypothetical protein